MVTWRQQVDERDRRWKTTLRAEARTVRRGRRRKLAWRVLLAVVIVVVLHVWLHLG